MSEDIRIVRPVERAWERMVLILFKPFSLRVWLVIGFAAFLSTLGQGGANFNFNLPTNWLGGQTTPSTQPTPIPAPIPAPQQTPLITPPPNSPSIQPAPSGTSQTLQPTPYTTSSPQSTHSFTYNVQTQTGWTFYTPYSTPSATFNSKEGFDEFVREIISILTGIPAWGWALIGTAFVFGLGLWILLYWLSSRGRFIFIDNLARNEAAIVRPWKEYASLANRYFGFRLFLAFGLSSIVLVLLAGAGALGFYDYNLQGFVGPWTIVAIAVLVGLAMFLGINIFILDLVTYDFIVPTMMLRRCGVKAALGIVWREILTGHWWPVILFYGMFFLLSIATTMVAIMISCITCCVIWIPYVSSVILLPITIFMRCFPLYYLAEYGAEWKIFQDDDGPKCPVCGYDLRGNPNASTCPECGANLLITDEMSPSSNDQPLLPPGSNDLLD